MRFGAWLAPKMSRRTVMVTSQVVGALAYVIDYRGRAAAHENLRVAFAKEHITPDQIRRIAVGSYQVFARTFLDLFWTQNLTRENYSELVEIQLEEPDIVAKAKEKGSLWVTAHFGNFEVISLVWGFRDMNFIVVAQDFKNPTLTGVFKMLREGTGHTVIPQQAAMLRLMKALKKGASSALVTDLNIPPNKTAAVIKCFGLETCVTTLHANLSDRLEIPVFPGLCIPLPDGKYRVVMLSALHAKDFATHGAMAQAVWDRFESAIREHPEAWLWMYKHWRYLPGDESDSLYPDYANPNTAFRKMLEARC